MICSCAASLAHVLAFKSLCRSFRGLLAFLTRGSRLIEEEPTDHKNRDAEIPYVLAEVDLSCCEHRDQICSKNPTSSQADAQWQHESPHPVIRKGRDEGGQSHEILIARPDRVREKLVQRGVGLLEGAGIVAQTEYRFMADTCMIPPTRAD